MVMAECWFTISAVCLFEKHNGRLRSADAPPRFGLVSMGNAFFWQRSLRTKWH